MAFNNPKYTTTIYTLPGVTTKIKALGHWVETKTVAHERMDGTVVEDASLVNGFYVDNEDVGTIEAVAGEPAIQYTHKKFSENYITFYAATEEIGKIFVSAIPIHDHSSIVTGGPAYGTYFADDETTENT